MIVSSVEVRRIIANHVPNLNAESPSISAIFN